MAALVIGFDFSIEHGFQRLLGEEPPGTQDDALVELLGQAQSTGPAADGSPAPGRGVGEPRSSALAEGIACRPGARGADARCGSSPAAD